VKKINFILLLLLIISNNTVFSEIINIGIFDKQKITSFIFSPEIGSYAVYTEQGKLTNLSNSDILQLHFTNDRIIIKSLEKDYGSFTKVKFIGTSQQNSFKVKPNKPNRKIRYYEDNLLVNRHNFYNYLQLINNIELDNYIAGVVEAEVGRSPPEEYFKLQAIICRTYALKNINRHKAEGFSLCNKVHCQAYHGKPKSKLIHKAAEETKGTIIVDSDINLITATFYSNCGGQTANSEDVWKQKLYYLRSTIDTFCLKENNAVWSKKIVKKDWLNYLSKKHHYPRSELNIECSAQYFQNCRERYFIDNNVKIPLVDIRKDWRFKSAQFDVIPDGNFVIVKGKGFGHGVGLCQEGAMRMAKMGYSYAKILHFYYQDVHMVDINSLYFFKEDY